MSVGSTDMAPGNPPPALAIALGPGLAALADPLMGGDLADWVAAWHQQAEAALGFAPPRVTLVLAPHHGPHDYAIRIAGLDLRVGQAYPTLALVVPRARTRAPWAPAGLPHVEPSSRKAAWWEGAVSAEAARAAGHRVLAPAELIVTQLDDMVRRHAAHFYGPRAAEATLARARATVPAQAVTVRRRLGTAGFQAVARDLLEEGATLAEPAALMTALAGAPVGLQDPADLAEYARAAVPELVDPRFLGPPREFPALRVGRLSAAVLRRQLALGPHAEGFFAGLIQGAAEGWMEGLATTLLGWRARGVRPVLVCPAALRRPIAALARLLTPDVTVVAAEAVPAGWQPREMEPFARADEVETSLANGLPAKAPGPRRVARAAEPAATPVVVLRERQLLAHSDPPASLLGHLPPAEALALLAGTPAPEVAALLGALPAAAADRVIAHLGADLQGLVVRLMAHHAGGPEAFALAQGAWLERLGLRRWLQPEPDPVSGGLAPARAGGVAPAPTSGSPATADWLVPDRPLPAGRRWPRPGRFDFLGEAPPARVAALLAALPREDVAGVLAMLDTDVEGAVRAAAAPDLVLAWEAAAGERQAPSPAQAASLAELLLRQLLRASCGEPEEPSAPDDGRRDGPRVVVLREADLAAVDPAGPRLAGIGRAPAADVEAALRALAPAEAALVLAACGRARTRAVLGRMPPARRAAVREALAALDDQPEAVLDGLEARVAAHFALDPEGPGPAAGSFAPTLPGRDAPSARRPRWAAEPEVPPDLAPGASFDALFDEALAPFEAGVDPAWPLAFARSLDPRLLAEGLMRAPFALALAALGAMEPADADDVMVVMPPAPQEAFFWALQAHEPLPLPPALARRLGAYFRRHFGV